MTTITDKLRKNDYDKKAPNIKPTLKNTIYDYKPDQIKSFELARTKYLDNDYKDGSKAKEFQKANIDVLEDTGIKNISGVSFNEDPFGAFFGLTLEKVPDRHLDGYYQYNLKGMTNEKFMKDRLLTGEGNMTDLERRLQNKAEFMELLERQQAFRDSLQEGLDDTIADAYGTEKSRIIADDRRRGVNADTTREKLAKKKIEIQRAITARNAPRNEDMAKENDEELATEVKHIKSLDYKDKNIEDVMKIEGLIKDIEDGKGLRTIRYKGMNNIFQKYNLPLLTTTMKASQKTEVLESNLKQIKQFIDRSGDKIASLNANVRRRQAKAKVERLKARRDAVMEEDDDVEEELFPLTTALGSPARAPPPPRREATPPPPPPPRREATPPKADAKTTMTAGGGAKATAGGGAKPTAGGGAKATPKAPEPVKGILKPPGGAGGGAPKASGIPVKGGPPPPPPAMTAKDMPVAPPSTERLQLAVSDFELTIGNRPNHADLTPTEIQFLMQYNDLFPTGKITGNTTTKTAKQKLAQLKLEYGSRTLPIVRNPALPRTPVKATTTIAGVKQSPSGGYEL